jgi:hypothetical protein
MRRAAAGGAWAVCALAAASLAACASESEEAAPRATTAPPPATTVATPRTTARPAARPPDLRGVAAADARRISGYRGWTVQRGRPSGDLAALGSAHRGGVKRIVVNRSAARLAPGGRQRYPYPVGTTIVKTAGPARSPTLVAIMYKVARSGAGDGGWDYVEYLRGSTSAPLVRLGGGEGVCTGCHMAAERAQGTDWVFSTLR